MIMIKGDDGMFAKLTFEQMEAFYGAVAQLEREYGKDRVIKGIKAMAEVLDENQADDFEKVEKQIGFISTTIDGAKVEQLELIEGGPGKKRYYGRRKVGVNERIIRDYCKSHFPDTTPEKAIFKMYYIDKMKQWQIGSLIGVDQRAISKFMSEISERKRQKWMKENVI